MNATNLRHEVSAKDIGSAWQSGLSNATTADVNVLLDTNVIKMD